MKNKTFITLILLTAQLSVYAQQTYQLDVKKSKILWDTGNAMGKHKGYLLFSEGTITYSAAGQPVGGKFTMDMKSMRATDRATKEKNAKVDKELQTPGFFNVAKYPTAHMLIKQIAPTGKPGIFDIKGDLTIKGITHAILFTAAIRKNGNIITAEAQTVLDRVKWKIDMKDEPAEWDILATIKNKALAAGIPISISLVFK